MPTASVSNYRSESDLGGRGGFNTEERFLSSPEG